jgi:hemoglobin
MKKDIRDRSDIQQLVDSFYEKVRNDDTIGYLFNDVAKVDWERHLPRMYDFWESIAFQTGSFSGNPMSAHMLLHQKSPLNKEHFAQWLHLFLGTADDLFEGEKTELIKQRARSIATMMQIKIINSGISGL